MFFTTDISSAIAVLGMRGRFQIVDIGTLLLSPLTFFMIGSFLPELHGLGNALLANHHRSCRDVRCGIKDLCN